jgi:hypothetical protein
MALYMTQKMSSGVLPAINYYRKQSAHPSHGESGAFTTAAQNDYAATRNVLVATVIPAKYFSNQGIPTGGVTKEI